MKLIQWGWDDLKGFTMMAILPSSSLHVSFFILYNDVVVVCFVMLMWTLIYGCIVNVSFCLHINLCILGIHICYFCKNYILLLHAYSQTPRCYITYVVHIALFMKREQNHESFPPSQCELFVQHMQYC